MDSVVMVEKQVVCVAWGLLFILEKLVGLLKKIIKVYKQLDEKLVLFLLSDLNRVCSKDTVIEKV